MKGQIDSVKPEGIVEGWCWNEAAPNDKVDVTVLVDGVEAGHGLAGLYRDDLRQAQIGDGYHAFIVILSTLVPSDRRTQTFTVVDTTTRTPVGTPFIFVNKHVRGVEDRLIELEARNRLLESRLEDLTRLARDAATPPSELFSVVGAFFTRLAEDMEKGTVPASLEQRLDALVKTAIKSYPTITFPIPDRLVVTVLVQASTCSLAQLHLCLASLQRAGAGKVARVIVIDTGEIDEVSLVPTVVRGIHYVRTVASLSSEWAEAERGDASDIVVLLSGRAVITPFWLTELIDSFAQNSRAGALGGVAIDADGIVYHGGLRLDEGLLEDVMIHDTEADDELLSAYPVHALSHHAAAFRRSALRDVGTIDGAFGDDLGAGVIDLCLRLRRAGWSILAQPFAKLTLQGETWVTPSLAVTSRAGDLLRSRWFEPQVEHRPLLAGSAVILGQAGEFAEELRAVQHLRNADYSVRYIGPETTPMRYVDPLRRAGAAVTMTNEAGELLAKSAADIVFSAKQVAPFARSMDHMIVVGVEALAQALPILNMSESPNARAIEK